MIPERSWWNPEVAPSAAAYVLQHEQIHFALTELAARRLTRDTVAPAAGLLVVQPNPQEVQSEITRQMRDWIAAAMTANLKRHAEFDEHTSFFYNPRRQQWWAREVEDELNRTEAARTWHDRPGRTVMRMAGRCTRSAPMAVAASVRLDGRPMRSYLAGC